MILDNGLTLRATGSRRNYDATIWSGGVGWWLRWGKKIQRDSVNFSKSKSFPYYTISFSIIQLIRLVNIVLN